MDSVQGSWPPNTILREIAADPDELADLIREWRENRPAELEGIIWYRLPVETDARNWRFATLATVANGRKPHRQVDVFSEGMNPMDVAIRNAGEADERLQMKVIVDSDQPAVDADALTGCRVSMHGTQSIFATEGSEALRLRPGETRSLGWLRFASPARARLHVVRQP